MKTRVFLFTLLYCASLHAAELVLTWEWPSDFTPAPDSFLVSYRSATAPQTLQQFRLPNLGRASCDGVQQTLTLTPDSVCGRPPSCLPPALYVFTVQAEVGEQQSPPSAPTACAILPNCVAQCQGVQLPPALQTLADAGLTEPPEPQRVAEVVETLAQTPAPPATPSVTTPAPTIADILDHVAGALSARPQAPV